MATQTRRSKNKGPQQITVLTTELTVLRKIDVRFPGLTAREKQNLINTLAQTQLEPGVPESDMAWFADGYVANNHPRDSIISNNLIRFTIPGEFAVARTDTGEIIRAGMDMAAAERAVAGAKVQLAIDVDLDDEDDQDMEPEAFDQEVPAEAEDETPTEDE